MPYYGSHGYLACLCGPPDEASILSGLAKVTAGVREAGDVDEAQRERAGIEKRLRDLEEKVGGGAGRGARARTGRVAGMEGVVGRPVVSAAEGQLQLRAAEGAEGCIEMGSQRWRQSTERACTPGLGVRTQRRRRRQPLCLRLKYCAMRWTSVVINLYRCTDSTCRQCLPIPGSPSSAAPAGEAACGCG